MFKYTKKNELVCDTSHGQIHLTFRSIFRKNDLLKAQQIALWTNFWGCKPTPTPVGVHLLSYSILGTSHHEKIVKRIEKLRNNGNTTRFIIKAGQYLSTNAMHITHINLESMFLCVISVQYSRHIVQFATKSSLNWWWNNTWPDPHRSNQSWKTSYWGKNILSPFARAVARSSSFGPLKTKGWGFAYRHLMQSVTTVLWWHFACPSPKRIICSMTKFNISITFL